LQTVFSGILWLRFSYPVFRLLKPHFGMNHRRIRYLRETQVYQRDYCSTQLSVVLYFPHNVPASHHRQPDILRAPFKQNQTAANRQTRILVLCSPTWRSQISQRLKISSRSSVAPSIDSSSQCSLFICWRGIASE